MLVSWVWTLLEGIAVILAILYLLLAVQERLSCWYAAALSSALYIYIFYAYAGLLFESLLQCYYLGMAGYGYFSWRAGAASTRGTKRITRRSMHYHGIAMVSIAVLSVVAGYLAQRYTDAQLPFLDAWTTIASIFTTWLVVRKILENWMYWILIDAVSIYLYIDRALYLTAGLFCAYIVIAVFGWREWHRHYNAEDQSVR